ncbi:MAG: hypothetical protein U0U33_20770 [Chitinophagaceae bacterium]
MPEIRTGRDYNNPDLPKNRSTAAAETVVDGVMYASEKKHLEALKVENGVFRKTKWPFQKPLKALMQENPVIFARRKK